jgi:hypothetical protein
LLEGASPAGFGLDRRPPKEADGRGLDRLCGLVYIDGPAGDGKKKLKPSGSLRMESRGDVGGRKVVRLLGPGFLGLALLGKRANRARVSGVEQLAVRAKRS